ncbi:hypothetical protein JCM10213_004093 [Rhodosporidiobolus nylandii]
MSSLSSQTIAVVGATGHQGSGVVASLLSSTPFNVRAITSNPSSAAAEELLRKHSVAVKSGRLTIVEGNLTDRASLEKALEGAHGLFAAWLSRGDELAEGKTLVDAAKSAGVAHFVYSSLPSLAEASYGKCTGVGEFDDKAAVAKYAEEHLPSVTLLFAGVFFENLTMPLYAYRAKDGTATFRTPINPIKPFQWVDESHDVGVYAAAVFSKGARAMADKCFPVESEPITVVQLAKEYEVLSGEKAVVETAPPETLLKLAGLPEARQRMLAEMYNYLNLPDVPTGLAYGTLKKNTSFADLRVQASTFEEWVKRTGFRVGEK